MNAALQKMRRPGLRNIPLLISIYLGIALIVLISERLGSPLAWLLGMPLIAALQNHLQILEHEAAHGHLLRSRKWNDRVGNLFCSIPFLGSLRAYKAFHFEHHRFAGNPDKDPEIPFYRKQGYRFHGFELKALLKTSFLDLCGYHWGSFSLDYARYLKKTLRTNGLRSNVRTLGLILSVILFLAVFPEIFRLYLLYWLIPQCTLLFFFLKIQGYGEHGPRNGDVGESTHDLQVGLLARFFIYPLNSNHHRVHHLNPSMPWYELNTLLSEPSIVGLCTGEKSLLKWLTRDSDQYPDRVKTGANTQG
jgi:fatty acid desaturase